VANCHKVPQMRLKEVCFQIEKISQSSRGSYTIKLELEMLRAKLFLTAPGTSLKDRFLVKNQQSKGAYDNGRFHQGLKKEYRLFLPAYELMMDELRDISLLCKGMVASNQLAMIISAEKILHLLDDQRINGVMEKVSAVQKTGLKP